jgi:hypothetical protein
MSVPSEQLAAVLPGGPAGERAPLDESQIPSRWGIVLARFRRKRLAMLGLVVLALLFALAFLGPY